MKGWKRRVKGIVETCRAIEKGRLDPFMLDVPKALKELKSGLDGLIAFDDYLLDAKAIHGVSKVVKLQSDWVKDRTSKLYVDPSLVEWRIRGAEVKGLVKAFTGSWHPIACFSEITKEALEAAIAYWNRLPRLKGRWKGLPKPVEGVELTSLDELISSKLALKGSFNDFIAEFKSKLKREADVKGKIPYLEFISGKDYEETVLRAYITSFLVTYGYADLELDPVTGQYYLTPSEPSPKLERVKSIPIPVEAVKDGG
ncbi:MAG: hypothetical protein QXD44_08500 [Candidatus Nezhaarchaeales archaeon]